MSEICPSCAGIHYGSGDCPYTRAEDCRGCGQLIAQGQPRRHNNIGEPFHMACRVIDWVAQQKVRKEQEPSTERTYTRADLDAAVAAALEPVRALVGQVPHCCECQTSPERLLAEGCHWRKVVCPTCHRCQLEAALASAPSLDAIIAQAKQDGRDNRDVDWLMVLSGEEEPDEQQKVMLATHDDAIREQARAEGALEEHDRCCQLCDYRAPVVIVCERRNELQAALERAKGASHENDS